MGQLDGKVIPFTPGRDIAREVAEAVAKTAFHHWRMPVHVRLTELELAEVILVAIGTYRQAVGR